MSSLLLRVWRLSTYCSINLDSSPTKQYYKFHNHSIWFGLDLYLAQSMTPKIKLQVTYHTISGVESTIYWSVMLEIINFRLAVAEEK